MRDEALHEIGDGRLLAPHVDRGARHVPRLERGEQIALVDDAAARAVDDAHARLHQGDLAGAEHALRLVGERHVHGDDVGLGEHGARSVSRTPSSRARLSGMYGS